MTKTVIVHRAPFIDRQKHRVLVFTPSLKIRVRVKAKAGPARYTWTCPVAGVPGWSRTAKDLRKSIHQKLMAELAMYKWNNYGPFVEFFAKGKVHELVTRDCDCRGCNPMRGPKP